MLDAIILIVLLITQFMTWVYLYDLKKNLYRDSNSKNNNDNLMK